MPGHVATASVSVVWPFLSLARQSGRDVTLRICEALEVSQAELADPSTRVPMPMLARLFADALARTGDRNIGLLAARHMASLHLGLFEDVTRTKATLGSAMEAGIRYTPLICDGAHYGFEVDGDRAVWRVWFDPGMDVHEAGVEFVVAMSVLWARRMTGLMDRSPLEVHFTHEQPADISLHKELFQCKLFFGAPATMIVAPATVLERPLTSHEPALAGLFQRRAEDLLQELPRPPYAEAMVRQILASRRELRHVSAEQVARRLGLGARTLARRLREEQTSYREVLDEVRREAAQRALAEGDRSLADIAHSLGFASPQGFNRAFRRWTGTSAAAWRRRNRMASL